MNDSLAVKRHPERAVRERDAALAVLDAGRICHVGFVADGRPWVMPTMYARDGERLLLHGSPLSRMLTTLASGAEICVTVTLLDGVVLARSAFSHSMNYRSVVVVGRAVEITEPAAKVEAMRCLVEHVLPGRWSEVRAPSRKEIATTTVVELPLDRMSMKARSGPPKEPAADRRLPVWGGELPLREVMGEPQPDALVDAAAPLPGSVVSVRAHRQPDEPRDDGGHLVG